MEKENWREKYSSQNKYDAENTVRTNIKVNRKTESDIYEALEKAPNKQRFIKNAIRFYLANGGEE